MDLSMQKSGLDGNSFENSMPWPIYLRERDVVPIAQEAELFRPIKWTVLQGIREKQTRLSFKTQQRTALEYMCLTM